MKYDVIVVGAGPAGSTAAKFLSEKGKKVLLLDKCKFPRDKPCGGGLTAKVLEQFPYVVENELIDSYCHGMTTYSSSLRYHITVKKKEPIIAMVLRKKFDEGLVRLAIARGTTFRDNSLVVDVKIFNDIVKVFLNTGEILDCEIVIGADGVWSIVGEKTGLREPHHNFSIALFQEYPVKKEIMDQYFTEDRCGYLHLKVGGIAGYGWVFPKKERVNIGIGETQPATMKKPKKTNMKEVYDTYFQMLKEQKIIPDTLEKGKVRGAALPTRPFVRTYSDRVLLCGDAAGLINSFTGEGMDYAMYSGKIAADIIVESLKKKDSSARFLSRYEQKWKKEFGKDIALFSKASKQWGNDSEKVIKLVQTDQRMADMFVKVATGNVSIHKYKWKLGRRFLFLTIKNFFKKKRR